MSRSRTTHRERQAARPPPPSSAQPAVPPAPVASDFADVEVGYQHIRKGVAPKIGERPAADARAGARRAEAAADDSEPVTWGAAHAAARDARVGAGRAAREAAALEAGSLPRAKGDAFCLRPSMLARGPYGVHDRERALGALGGALDAELEGFRCVQAHRARADRGEGADAHGRVREFTTQFPAKQVFTRTGLAMRT